MSAALDALESELPDAALERHAPVEVDGVAVAATLLPADGAGLARAVAALARIGLAALPRGAGGHLGLGNPPSRADLFLSTQALTGVHAFEPAEGVCRAGAGTSLAQLRETVAAEGWELPLEGPGSATLGGALAAASVGPRSLRYGPARDAVLGLDVVLGSGERTRCGGRVVKNVTGYDLAKLYTGSLGSLGVIESAWLRLRPRPETTRVVARRIDAGEGCEVGLRAARRTAARACALLDGSELVVELAGDAAGVAADAAAIGDDGCDAARLDALAALQWGEAPGGSPAEAPAGGDALRFRIGALASELPAVVGALLRAGVRALAYPGMGLVYAFGSAAQAPAFLEALEAAGRAASGPLRCEVAPAGVKRRRGDVFGARDAEVRLFRALKRRFDPHDVLSPGRLVGSA